MTTRFRTGDALACEAWSPRQKAVRCNGGIQLPDNSPVRPLFEGSKNMPHFEDVFRTWQRACVKFTIGTSGEKMGQGATFDESAFLYQLANGNPRHALQKFHWLIYSRAKTGDLEFLIAWRSSEESGTINRYLDLTNGGLMLELQAARLDGATTRKIHELISDSRKEPK
jgi:hypothetical protein